MTNKISYEDYEEDIRKMVSGFIRRTSHHLYEQFDDLVNEATVKFLECQRDYDKGLPFKPYLRRCINNSLLDYIRKEIQYNKAKQESRERVMDYQDSTDLDLDYEVSEALCTITKQHEYKEDMYDEGLEELMNKCKEVTAREKEVLLSFLTNNGNVDLTATACNISKRVVYKNISSVVEKLGEFV